jgi:hypothetical protein
LDVLASASGLCYGISIDAERDFTIGFSTIHSRECGRIDHCVRTDGSD